MAYSDYGGFAYRNGEHVLDRSDAVLTPEGLKSTPGMWPGFALEEGRSGGSYHVILGDGPVFVTLYKQSSLGINHLGENIELTEAFVGDAPTWSYEDKTYFDDDHFKAEETPAVFEVDGHKIEAYFLVSDNHYLYVKLTQPDGTVWTGFSGYGVGAGLEDAGYGYSTEDQIEKLRSLFPASLPKEEVK